MKFFLLWMIVFSTLVIAEEQLVPLFKGEILPVTKDETDEIYWETPEYTSRLETLDKIQYVYHFRAPNFRGIGLYL